MEFAALQFRGRRAGDRGFALALIDIDHFKGVNDNFGHSVGDAVLTAFGQACQRQLRSDDRLGRFGGEEFMLVMTGAEIPPVAAVFERLRQAVSKIAVEGYPLGRTLTFSMGATAVRLDETLLDAIIRRADEALYKAKHSGRDRYEIG